MKWLKVVLGIIVVIVVIVTLHGIFKPLPKGISLEGKSYYNSKVEFIYDLTYEENGKVIHQQNIFNQAFKIIDEAEKFIIVDMFLFNDTYNRKDEYPQLAATLTRTLVNKKEKDPHVKIVFIADEINTFYGSYPAKFLEELKQNDIEVVLTNLNSLRDSNPLYSGVWNTFIRWLGTEGKGWLPNAFSSEAPKVTARSYLKLLNFKANHRKVVISEKKALISSANPHDASAFHSNIAFVVQGEIIKDLVASEQAVVAFSGKELNWSFVENSEVQGDTGEDHITKKLVDTPEEIKEAVSNALTLTTNPTEPEVCLLTEGKIKKHLLKELKSAGQDDFIWIGMFYLADRSVIAELLNASWRGAEVRLVLDQNKDAFGLEKNGIPNKPVASELYKESEGKIKIKWYKTHGEQFHTKLVLIKGRGKNVIFGGSANLTKRNIGDYNLEADLKISAPTDNKIVQEVETYFNRLWSNMEGTYTVEMEEYQDDSFWKKACYLFQEWTGLASF